MNLLLRLFNRTTKTQGLPSQVTQHKPIETKSPAELEIMRRSGRIVATVLREIEQMITPGMTTQELDTYAEQRIRGLGAIPSFKGYHGFPASICISINDEVVHGIPSPKRIIRAGDLVKVDTGACYQGYHGDSCITIAVGKTKKAARSLMAVAEKALFKGIEQVKAGNYLLDIAGAIEDYVLGEGYSIVPDYCGHGVGRNLHEQPSVFNARTDRLPNVQLQAGMTLAIEPIVNQYGEETKLLKDQWTVVTQDQGLSAQFEHTVLVTARGYEIFTLRD